jgi:uncharacterized protein (DUF1778 family)
MPKAATTDLNAEALPRTKRREDAKPGRFQARISERQRELFQRAAAIEGRSVTDFVLAHAQEAAQHAIERESVLVLNKQDSEAFLAALLSPEPPTPEVLADVQSMRAFFGEVPGPQ